MANIKISFWICTIFYMYIKFYTQQYPYLLTPWTNLWMPWTMDHQDQLRSAWSIHMDVSGATQQCDVDKLAIGEPSWDDFQHGSFQLHINLYWLMWYQTLSPTISFKSPHSATLSNADIAKLWPVPLLTIGIPIAVGDIVEPGILRTTALTSWYCRILCASSTYITLPSHCSTLGHTFHLAMNESLMNVAFVACDVALQQSGWEWSHLSSRPLLSLYWQQ